MVNGVLVRESVAVIRPSGTPAFPTNMITMFKVGSDPQEDPHGALLWLDFLAVKSNNLEWLADLGDMIDLEGLPGMAYAKALATRIQEKKNVRWTQPTCMSRC